MKKMLRTAFVYAAAAMAGGVFYREFTRFSGFTGRTALGLVHTHLFMLGMMVFLLTALFVSRWGRSLAGLKKFRAFYIVYNLGVSLTTGLLLARGILQVRGKALSKAVDASVSGIAGIGHILTGAGILLLFLCLLDAADKLEREDGK